MIMVTLTSGETTSGSFSHGESHPQPARKETPPDCFQLGSHLRTGSNTWVMNDHHESSIIPFGKRSHNYGKSQFFIGNSTISMASFHSYVSVTEGK